MKGLFHSNSETLVKYTFILSILFTCSHLYAQPNNGKQDSLVGLIDERCEDLGR